MTIYHVNQAADSVLRTIREEVLDRENRAVVAITGPQGVGKTERLLVTAAEARERKAFVVYFDVTTSTPWALKGVAEAFSKTAKEAGLVKVFGSPSWLRPLGALARSKGESYDPKDAGRQIGEALNATTPSLLLLNDLHNLAESREVEMFARALEEVTGVIKPGVLVMIGCYASYLAWLTANQPALASRINRVIPLVGLSDDEARLVLAKKLLAKRVVEDLEPTYPFDRDAVHELNGAARGNPRRLFEFADIALERGVATRAYQIDGDLVQTAFTARDKVAAVSAPHSEPPEWAETPVVAPRVAPSPPGGVDRRSVLGKRK